MKVGRNEPCPCGSGRKYKKCCLGTDFDPALLDDPPLPPAEAADDDFISPGEIGDCGEPRLGEEFFADKDFSGLSPQTLLYNMLLRPGLLSTVAGTLKPQLTRGRAEEQRIERADLSGLIAIMRESPDPLNHHLIIERVAAQIDAALPLILEELAGDPSDSFAELSVHIIYQTEADCAGELIGLVKRPIRNAYVLSLVCLLLGLMRAEEATKPLWDCYHFFRERFPRKSYEQGPLLGLYELYYGPEDAAPSCPPGAADAEGAEAGAEAGVSHTGRRIDGTAGERKPEDI